MFSITYREIPSTLTLSFAAINETSPVLTYRTRINTDLLNNLFTAFRVQSPTEVLRTDSAER